MIIEDGKLWRVRAEFEMAGLIWSRSARRRLARAGSGPGRRDARRWPLRRATAYRGFTTSNVAALSLIAVPGLDPRDMAIEAPQPGRVVVTIGGPWADPGAVEAVRAILAAHVPVGFDLAVHLASEDA